MKWYLPAVLIRIPLMTNEVEHLFMGSLATCISLMEKRLFEYFAYFSFGLFVFLV